MSLWPRSLAGRLAGLLVLTLVVAQVLGLALFAGERVVAFRAAFRDDMLARLTSLVDLLEETPRDLHPRLAATASSVLFRVRLSGAPDLDAGESNEAGALAAIAAALGKPKDDVRIAFAEPRRDGRKPRQGPPPDWVRVSIHLRDGAWLNAAAGRPPVPPLGGVFLATFAVSAVAVAVVGAIGVGWASRPLRQLAAAADRLGRGESFDALPESGPRETRKAHIAFNRMRERLERFIRDRTTMLAAVAHDLRTPITALRLRAELIDDEETRTRILETVAEMQAMTESALAFARGDAKGEPTRPTDLAALVESVVEDVAESGRAACFAESPPLPVTCRPFALKRAVGNLIDNAAAYGQRARASVVVTLDEARIVIDDDGPGIPEADLERVFEPFVRLENSRSRATGGAGLGLAIARTVARGHGGDLTLENRPGGGLRATLTLPRAAG